MRSRRGLQATFAVAAVALTSCDGESPRSPTAPLGTAGTAHAAAAPCAGSSLLLITLDTTRRDALGFAAGPAGAARTPTLDALALQSLEFTSTWAVAPLTRPAHASLFTGEWPAAHGVRDNLAMRLPAAATTLAERFAAGGYATSAVVAAPVVGGDSGLAQGFARFLAPPTDGSVPEWSARQVTDAALATLAEQARGGAAAPPFLLWAHYFDPHAPHLAPPTERRVSTNSTADRTGAELQSDLDPRADWPAYRSEIERVDRQLARLLVGARAAAGARPLTIVVTADHGEALGERGEATHGHLLQAATLQVPLLLHHPSLPPGRCGQLASQVDLLPTLLAAFGLPTDDRDDERIAGRSLLPWWNGDRARDDLESRIVLLESRLPWHEFGWPWLDGATDGRFLWHDRPTAALLDLAGVPATAPGAAQDCAALHPERAAALAAASAVAAARVAAPTAADRAAAGAASELLALGYVGARDDAPPAKATLVEPADRFALVRQRDRGLELLARGRYDAARAEFTALRDANPDPAPATLLLAVTASREAEALPDGETRRRALSIAAVAWQAAIAAAPNDARRHLNLGLTLLDAGDPAAARAALERANTLQPEDPAIEAVLAELGH